MSDLKKSEVYEEIDPWSNPPKNNHGYLAFAAFCVSLGMMLWFFFMSPNNRKPNLERMMQYKISILSEEELRNRLGAYETYIEKQKLFIERQSAEAKDVKSNRCLGKDEAFKLKNKCPSSFVIKTKLPQRDVILEAELFDVKESYVLQECFTVKTVRAAKQQGCLP